MKAKYVFNCLLLFAVVIAGCNSAEVADTPETVAEQVLPDYVVGKWKSEEQSWEFNIEPDGSISSAVISLGRVLIGPNQTEHITGQGGDPGVFESGDFTVTFNAENNELAVVIEMKHIRVKMYDSVLDGSSQYYFVGEVIPEQKAWYAHTYPTVDFDVFRIDPNDPDNPEKTEKMGELNSSETDLVELLTFTKVE